MRRGAGRDATPDAARLALAAAALAALAALGLSACGSSPEPHAAATARTTAAAAIPCRSAMRHGVIPTWARTGFSDPHPRMDHAVARGGRIAALAFGAPLHVPPGHEPANKILWVARRTPELGSGDLRISAQRMEGADTVGRPVVRTVDGGPGPSIVDVPHAGCWRLSLSWAHATDHVDLEYVAG